MQTFSNRWFNETKKSFSVLNNNPIQIDNNKTAQQLNIFFNSSVSQRPNCEHTTCNSSCNNSLAKNNIINAQKNVQVNCQSKLHNIQKVNLEILKDFCQDSSNRNRSQSKGKKYISITQRSNCNKSLSSISKKSSRYNNDSIKQSKQKQKFSYNQLKKQQVKQNIKTSLKKYLTNTLKTISWFQNQNGQELEALDEPQRQNILTQQIQIPYQIQYSHTQKAKKQRNILNKTLFERNKRINTQVSDSLLMIYQKQRYLNTEFESQWKYIEFNAKSSRKLIQDRNNTLTRQDSPILGLLNLIQQDEIIKMQEFERNENIKIQKSIISKIKLMRGEKSKEKRKDKVQNEDISKQINQKAIKSKVSQIQGITKLDSQIQVTKRRPKYISLIEKKQQQRYKNMAKMKKISSGQSKQSKQKIRQFVGENQKQTQIRQLREGYQRLVKQQVKR